MVTERAMLVDRQTPDFLSRKPRSHWRIVMTRALRRLQSKPDARVHVQRAPWSVAAVYIKDPSPTDMRLIGVVSDEGIKRAGVVGLSGRRVRE